MTSIPPEKRRKIALDTIYVANHVINEYPEVRPDFVYALTIMHHLENAGSRPILVSGQRALFLIGAYEEGHPDVVVKWVTDTSECYWVVNDDELIDLWPVTLKMLPPIFDIGKRTFQPPPGFWMKNSDIAAMPLCAVWHEKDRWMTLKDYQDKSPVAAGDTPFTYILQSIGETTKSLETNEIHQQAIMTQADDLLPIGILTKREQINADCPDLWMQSVFHANMTADELPLDVRKLLT